MNTTTATKTPASTDAAAPEELHVLSVLKSLREGEFIQELDEKLQEHIDTSTELGKPAKLVIALTITPAGRTVVIEDDIKPKLPEAIKDATIFFLDRGNKLTRKDPKQAQFPVEAGFTGSAGAART
jgi:hypothetical protein